MFILGFDVKRLRSYANLPKYFSHSRQFAKAGGYITRRNFQLCDWTDQAGSANGHYFHQDLLVANFIHNSKPKRHIDVGSRIDGFVAHVAAFRKIEVIDVRPLAKTGHENIVFLQADLMQGPGSKENITASLSCLHTIEHFGLGRYGDNIDPDGHLKGFINLLRILKTGGIFYISFPIGSETSVHFNAHRIFHPLEIFKWPTGNCTLKLKRFDYVDDSGNVFLNHDLNSGVPMLKHGCGIYTFLKQN